jgi:hypothetical protein
MNLVLFELDIDIVDADLDLRYRIWMPLICRDEIFDPNLGYSQFIDDEGQEFSIPILFNGENGGIDDLVDMNNHTLSTFSRDASSEGSKPGG